MLWPSHRQRAAKPSSLSATSPSGRVVHRLRPCPDACPSSCAARATPPGVTRESETAFRALARLTGRQEGRRPGAWPSSSPPPPTSGGDGAPVQTEAVAVYGPRSGRPTPPPSCISLSAPNGATHQLELFQFDTLKTAPADHCAPGYVAAPRVLVRTERFIAYTPRRARPPPPHPVRTPRPRPGGCAITDKLLTHARARRQQPWPGLPITNGSRSPSVDARELPQHQRHRRCRRHSRSPSPSSRTANTGQQHRLVAGWQIHPVRHRAALRAGAARPPRSPAATCRASARMSSVSSSAPPASSPAAPRPASPITPRSTTPTPPRRPETITPNALRSTKPGTQTRHPPRTPTPACRPPGAARNGASARKEAGRARQDRLRRHSPPSHHAAARPLRAVEPVISPDGKTLLFSATGANQQQLYTYSLDELSREPASPASSPPRPAAKPSSPSPRTRKRSSSSRTAASAPSRLKPAPQSLSPSPPASQVDFDQEKKVVFEEAWETLNRRFFDARTSTATTGASCTTNGSPTSTEPALPTSSAATSTCSSASSTARTPASTAPWAAERSPRRTWSHPRRQSGPSLRP